MCLLLPAFVLLHFFWFKSEKSPDAATEQKHNEALLSAQACCHPVLVRGILNDLKIGRRSSILMIYSVAMQTYIHPVLKKSVKNIANSI